MAQVRPELTPDLCLTIVVNATPHPQNPPNPATDLFALGVVDPPSTVKHKSKIQAALMKIQYQIKQSDITSGPGVLAGDCADTVLGHAH